MTLNEVIKALDIVGMKMYFPNTKKKGLQFISKKTGRRYSVQYSGNILGYSGKSSWVIGKGGLEGFLTKVYNRPKSYLGV
jgi:hypothetical protein